LQRNLLSHFTSLKESHSVFTALNDLLLLNLLHKSLGCLADFDDRSSIPCSFTALNILHNVHSGSEPLLGGYLVVVQAGDWGLECMEVSSIPSILINDMVRT